MMEASTMAVSYKKPTATEGPSRELADLGEAFAFRGDVQSMTDRNPHLVSLLREAREQVDRVFGSSAPIDLEVVENPEAADSSPELFAFIQTPLPVPAARERLERLDEEWWLDALPRAEGRLNIALEYI
jgi:hypothetical protein